MARMKDGIYCAKCNVESKLSVLSKYEYEEGTPLHNVQAYVCPKCKDIFFTEEQAHEMEARTQELREYSFGFERKVGVSGTSLVVGIPSELADHLKIKQGQKVRIIPIAKDGFMIRKLSA
jgi:phage FluMu protein Com